MDTEPIGRPDRGDAQEKPPAQLDYEALRLIGRGGYGEVWLVRDKTGRYLACKVIYRASFDNDRPYEREYEGIKKFEPVSLANESQVNILHIGRRDEAGYFYYIMELADDVAGGEVINPDHYVPKTLASELKRRGRLPTGECVRLGLALSAALENLHEHGLIHRDIKPGNIIFVKGMPKLADIGLVSDRDVTVSYVGTEGYIPPEGPGSAQADVYGLGKVLYELGTGKDRLEYPELPTDLGAGPDQDALLEFNAAVVKACERDPRKRYRTAGELHADLTLLSCGKSLRQRRKLERTRRTLARAALVVVALAIIAGGIVGYERWRMSLQTAAPEALADSDSYARTPDTSAQLAEVCIRTGFEAWDHDDYQRAREFGSKAHAAAEASHRPQLKEEAAFLETETARCESEYEKIKPMAGVLKEKSEDPEANLAIGRFLCFTKNDWQSGLPLLARGSSDALRTAAQKELTGQDEASVGDAWWNLAESATGGDKTGFQRRARTWYLKAIAKAKEPRKAELRQQFAARIKMETPASCEIHILSRVDNSQHIDIYADEVRWWNDGQSRGDKINYVLVGGFAGKSTRTIKNTGATRLYPEDLDFATAQLKIDRKPKKRGKVTFRIEDDHVRLILTDRPAGSSQMEVTITFGANAKKDNMSPKE